jgi:hypothetical protein
MKTSIGIIVALALAVSAFAQQLTDEQVRLAIERGAGKPHQIGLTLNDKQTFFFSAIACRTCGQSGYTITVYNPEQWVELCAAQAKKEMEPFGVADVTDQMRAQDLHVVALPSRAEYLTGSGIAGSSSVHRVVLNDTARQTTIQPLEVRRNTLQANSALRSFEYTMASAEFSLSDVARLRDSDPKGEFFIVVVGDNQNKFFKVKSRDFRILFPKDDNSSIAVPDRPTPAPAAMVMPAAAPPPPERVKPELVTAAQPTTAGAPAEPVAAPIPAGGAKVETVTAIQSPSAPAVAGATTTSVGLPEEALIGVSFTGNPAVRHDGVEIAGVQAKGPADSIDIKPGDVILAIDGHYLYTIDELRAELLKYEPGSRLKLRYRHSVLSTENYITIGSK